MKKFLKFCLVVILLSAQFLVANAQGLTVKGVITEASGDPIPGVNIVLKGTTTGAITDLDGNYTLTVPDENAVLVFSYVGYLNQEVAVGNQTSIDITLLEDVVGLEEVIVVGYGSQRKQTLSGAVSAVTAEDLAIRPAANTTELLQGQISGLLTRQESGLPGADGTTLQIRGYGSPYILIDGVEGTLGSIDPNDIESISVLKDASAAVYGAKAGNGVILVTTKRGRLSAAKITYHGTVSFTQPTFLPDRVGALKWAELLNESGLNPDDYSPLFVHYDPVNNTLTNTLDGSDYEGYDWSEALYKDWTPQNQHNLNASGGNERIAYFVSAGFTGQESNFKSGDYDYGRVNVRSNIDAKVSDDLTVSMDFSYRKGTLDKANFNPDGMYNSLQTAKPVYPFIHEADPDRATYSGFLQRTPYYQTFKDFSGTVLNENRILQGAVQLKYNLPWVEGLSAKARLSYEEVSNWNKSVSHPFNTWEYDPTESTPDGLWIRRGTSGANNMSVVSNKSTELLPLFSIEYERRFGDHNVRGMLISETRTYNWTSLSGSRKDILSFEAPFLNYASEEGKDNAESLTQSARTSFIGRLNYDYMGKYLFEFAMRADASAEYPPQGRWGYFPSVSAGWRLSEESFIRDNISAINNLKLRASYGILGNDAVSAFDYLTGYTISTNFYVFGSTPAPIIASAGLSNPNITWETMTMYNIGLDGTIWNGLLGFEIDGFYRLREDILATPTETVPSTFGASLPNTNLNKRDNRGFEILLRHRNKIGEISYEISPIFSWSRGKYVDWEEEVSDDPEWNKRYVNEGNWDDRQWGYETEGFFMSQDEVDNHPIDQDLTGNTTLKPGDLIYKDVNGDSQIDWRDEVVTGASGLPNIMYSMDMVFSYKGIRLGMLWQGAADYVVNFAGSAAGAFSNESIPLSQHYDYRAIVENDAIANPGDFELPPVTSLGRSQNNAKSSDFWTYDAKFIRLKNLNVSYSFPKTMLERVRVSQFVVYVSGTNLWTLSNLGIWKDSFDPEIVGQNGKDYPPIKTVTFGVRLTL